MRQSIEAMYPPKKYISKDQKDLGAEIAKHREATEEQLASSVMEIYKEAGLICGLDTETGCSRQVFSFSQGLQEDCQVAQFGGGRNMGIKSNNHLT